MELKPIPGSSGYFASAEGEIMSCRSGKNRKLTRSPNSREIARVSAIADDPAVGSSQTVGSLVCAAFHGPRPGPSFYARHINNVSDDKLCNLEWSTRRQIHKKGLARSFLARLELLTPQLLDVARRLAADEKIDSISEHYQVRPGLIRAIPAFLIELL